MRTPVPAGCQRQEAGRGAPWAKPSWADREPRLMAAALWLIASTVAVLGAALILFFHLLTLPASVCYRRKAGRRSMT